MSQITVEINGTGTHNRGAELMAIAISDRIRAVYPDARIVVPPRFGTPSERARYGFETTWEAVGNMGGLKTFVRSIAWRFKKGVVNPAGVDVVIDASGFAFSDQWGPVPAEVLTRKMNRSYRSSQPLLLLPQAFGPFEEPEVRTAVSALFSRAKLIFARDTKSFAEASELASGAQLTQAPDFTVAVNPVPAQNVRMPERFVGIVPNLRMVDKTATGDQYLGFLKAAISEIQAKGLSVAFVLHDAEEDRRVIDLLGESYASLPVLTHDDPRVLKWILGQAEFVIGSRFHALVSSLSQGVPCIGAGWSHKYPELFKDFDCPELLIADMADAESVRRLVSNLCDDEARSEASARISAAASLLKKRTEEMWGRVYSVLDNIRRSA